jgi:hypothetical protein
VSPVKHVAKTNQKVKSGNLLSPNDSEPAYSNLSVCVNLWLKTNNCHAMPSLLTSFCAVRLFPFPKLKMALKGRRFTDIMIQAKLQNPSDNVSNNRLHKMFQTVASIVGLLCEVPSGLHGGDNIG